MNNDSNTTENFFLLLKQWLDEVKTKVNANAITNALSTLTVTAKAEQIPKTCRVIGLLEINGSKI